MLFETGPEEYEWVFGDNNGRDSSEGILEEEQGESREILRDNNGGDFGESVPRDD